eukprot:658562-Pleurochrysis_carterae.AAC.1
MFYAGSQAAVTLTPRRIRRHLVLRSAISHAELPNSTVRQPSLHGARAHRASSTSLARRSPEIWRRA